MKSLRRFAASPLRRFAASPLRHASHLVTLVLLALAGTAANAALIVNVEGVPGSGKTTWTLSGSSTSKSSAAIRYGTDNTRYNWGDTLRTVQRFLSDKGKSKISKNSLFAVTGSPQFSTHSPARTNNWTIRHIFLGPNNSRAGDAGDAFGIRLSSYRSYPPGVSTRWSGRFTLDLDISNFKLGTYRSAPSYTANFAQAGDVTLTFKETASVPDPSSLALLGLALASLGFSRKLTSAQAKA